MIHPEFELDPDLVYLNHAGVAPWPRRTAEAVARFAEENRRHGALGYPRWLAVEKRLRRRLRTLLNAPDEDDIALVKNTSEAISFVAWGLSWREGDNVVTSNEEFPSNRIPWEALAGAGVDLRQADLGSAREPEEALFAQADQNTRLLTISSVQYASGRRMNLDRIGEFCRKHDILFCVDAIQSLGALRADVQAWQADFVMADGHKWLLGPEGLGVFYSTPDARERLRLFEYGWHMVERAGDYDRRGWQPARSARRFECGSPNMLGIHALEASLSLLEETGMQAVERRLLAHAVLLMDAIEAEERLELLTPRKYHGGIVTFRPRHGDTVGLFEFLCRHGVICALRGGGIRFSPHFYPGREELERALGILTQGLGQC